MKRIRLLIIDEHPSVRLALAARLGVYAGTDIVGTLARPGDRLVRDEKGAAQVVLFGLKSCHNGWMEAVVEDVRRMCAQGITVIILAPYARDDERERLLAAGARRYLLKDINSAELIKEIEAAVAEVALEKRDFTASTDGGIEATH